MPELAEVEQGAGMTVEEANAKAKVWAVTVD